MAGQQLLGCCIAAADGFVFFEHRPLIPHQPVAGGIKAEEYRRDRLRQRETALVETAVHQEPDRAAAVAGEVVAIHADDLAFGDADAVEKIPHGQRLDVIADVD